MADTPYNVLLISSDHHRGDAFGILGHPVVQTPHLDKLAQQGILFRRAYSECPVCIPARMSIMTGLRPGIGEGSIGCNYYKECDPIRSEQTLPLLFRDAGYQTQAIGKMHFFPQRKRYGFDNMILDEEGRILPGLHRDDYEQWLHDQGFAGQYHSHGLTNNETSARPWHLPEQAHPTNWTARETCRWFNRLDPGSPFFLWMSFSAPHPPYTPPMAYWELYRDMEVPEPAAGDWCGAGKLPAGFVRSRLPGNYDTREGEWYRKTARAYYALVTQIDHQISLVIGTLRERKMLDRTIILYIADHGDLLGDFGTFGKRIFYEGAANIPFILVLPREHPDNRYGEVNMNPVGLQDVLPTLLDSAGVDMPGSITGVSALAGLRDPNKARKTIHGNYTRGPDAPDSSHMLTDGHMKYIWYNEGNIEHLFDLEKDPREAVNLAAQPENAFLVEQWRERLVAELEEEGSPDVKRGKLVSLPYPELDEAALRSMDPFNPRGMHY